MLLIATARVACAIAAQHSACDSARLESALCVHITWQPRAVAKAVVVHPTGRKVVSAKVPPWVRIFRTASVARCFLPCPAVAHGVHTGAKAPTFPRRRRRRRRRWRGWYGIARAAVCAVSAIPTHGVRASGLKPTILTAPIVGISARVVAVQVVRQRRRRRRKGCHPPSTAALSV